MRPFRERAIDWARTQMPVATEVLPTHRIEDDGGQARIAAVLIHPSRAGTYAFASTAAMLVGSVLTMASLPGLGPTVGATIDGLGWVSLLAALGLLTAAWLTRRRHREPLLIALRGAASGPATADAIAELRRDAGTAAAWVVAEAGVDEEGLARARSLGVRCFKPSDAAFDEL